jgi:hypothetical protein
MRHTEFWARLEAALGASYAPFWAGQQVLSELGGRTPAEAVDGGVSPKQVWAAVHRALERPPRDK